MSECSAPDKYQQFLMQPEIRERINAIFCSAQTLDQHNTLLESHFERGPNGVMHWSEGGAWHATHYAREVRIIQKETQNWYQLLGHKANIPLHSATLPFVISEHTYNDGAMWVSVINRSWAYYPDAKRPLNYFHGVELTTLEPNQSLPSTIRQRFLFSVANDGVQLRPFNALHEITLEEPGDIWQGLSRLLSQVEYVDNKSQIALARSIEEACAQIDILSQAVSVESQECLNEVWPLVADAVIIAVKDQPQFERFYAALYEALRLYACTHCSLGTCQRMRLGDFNSATDLDRVRLLLPRIK